MVRARDGVRLERNGRKTLAKRVLLFQPLTGHTSQLRFAFSEAQRSQKVFLDINHQHQAPKKLPDRRTRSRRRRTRTSTGGSSKSSVGSTISEASVRQVLGLRLAMVACKQGASESAVGRISLVSEHGVLYDTFVRVPVQVADHRTALTGIQPGDLQGPRAVSFDEARTNLVERMEDNIVVGHGLDYDLSILKLNYEHTRDCATYPAYAQENELPRPLNELCVQVLGQDVPSDELRPIHEARACIDLYYAVRHDWEGEILMKKHLRERQFHVIKSMRANAMGRPFHSWKDDRSIPRSIHGSMEDGFSDTSSFQSGSYLKHEDHANNTDTTVPTIWSEGVENWRSDAKSETASWAPDRPTGDSASWAGPRKSGQAWTGPPADDSSSWAAGRPRKEKPSWTRPKGDNASWSDHPTSLMQPSATEWTPPSRKQWNPLTTGAAHQPSTGLSPIGPHAADVDEELIHHLPSQLLE